MALKGNNFLLRKSSKKQLCTEKIVTIPRTAPFKYNGTNFVLKKGKTRLEFPNHSVLTLADGKTAHVDATCPMKGNSYFPFEFIYNYALSSGSIQNLNFPNVKMLHI